MKAAIAIDTWKLPIFERRLKQNGYTYTQSKGVTDDTMLLYVRTDNVMALETVIREANIEAAMSLGAR